MFQAQKEELDKQITQHLKAGWTIDRLTLVEKNLLRLGVFEITSFDTPQLVAVNEAIELAKSFSDQKSARFINGLLSQFVTEEKLTIKKCLISIKHFFICHLKFSI